MFDRLLVAVLVNTRKSPSRGADERAAILRSAIDEELAGSSGRASRCWPSRG